MVIELNDQIDELKIEADKLRQNIKELKTQEAAYKKDIQGLKYDNKRQSCDLKDAKERFEKVKIDYQTQFTSLKQTTVAMKQQLQKEYDQRIDGERKFQQVQKQLKISRQDNQTLEAEIQLLMKAIEEMQYEQKYLQELRGEISDEEKKEESDEGEVDEDGQPVKPKKLSEHEEFEEKLTENAEDCARHHFRLLQVTKKEYKILQKQFDSQKEKSDILRNQLEDANSKLKPADESSPEVKREEPQDGENLEKIEQEAEEYKQKSESQGQQMADLEGQIATIKANLEEAEKQKQALRDAQLSKSESEGTDKLNLIEEHESKINSCCVCSNSLVESFGIRRLFPLWSPPYVADAGIPVLDVEFCCLSAGWPNYSMAPRATVYASLPRDPDLVWFDLWTELF